MSISSGADTSSRVTARYWGRQVMTHIGVLVTAIYLLTLIGSLVFAGTLHVHPVWTAVTLIFMAERVVSVRERGVWQMLLASTLVVEIVQRAATPGFTGS